MRIALLVWTARAGAFANLAQALAEGLRLNGAEEVLIVHLAEGPAGPTPPGVRAVPLGASRARSSVPSIRRLLREEVADVLVPMLPLVAIPTVVSSFLVRNRRTKIVVYHSDTMSSDYRIDHRWNLRMRAVPLAARFLYPRVDGLVAETDALHSMLAAEGIDMGARPVEIIPPPVDVDATRSRASADATHPWLTDKSFPVVTSLGRLVKRKSFPLLVEAIADERRRRDVRLVIFGEGPEREAILRAAGTDAHRWLDLPGYVANPFAEIARSDAFVMPSRDEAFCLALAEAMSCGVPVVSTDAAGGGPRYILEGGRFGALVPTGDGPALTAAVERLLDDRSLAERSAQQSRARADDFHPRRIGARWMEFLETKVVAPPG